VSNKELAKALIDQIPESKMFYIVSYLEGAVVPEEIPNAETIAALNEYDAEYMAELDRRSKRLDMGEGIHKTLEELEAMEHG